MYGRKKKGIQALKPYLLLLPVLSLFALLVYYPFIKTIITSFAYTSDIGEFKSWAGTEHYVEVFTDPGFLKTTANTFMLAGLCLVIELSLSMTFALLSVKERKGSRVYQTLFSLPLVISATAIASVWMFIFRPTSGLLNSLLGTELNLLGNRKTALTLIAFLTCWGSAAGKYLWLMAGFRNVSQDLIEAATIDGAGWFKRATKILIPMASPQIFYVLFTSIIGAFKHFTMIYLLTRGGPMGSTTTYMYEAYRHIQELMYPEVACVWSLLLFVLIFVFTRIQFAFEKKMVFYQ